MGYGFRLLGRFTPYAFSAAATFILFSAVYGFTGAYGTLLGSFIGGFRLRFAAFAAAAFAPTRRRSEGFTNKSPYGRAAARAAPTGAPGTRPAPSAPDSAVASSPVSAAEAAPPPP